MRRSTVFAVLLTALVLIAAGSSPAMLADAGSRTASQWIAQVRAWRPAPRIASPRPTPDSAPARPMVPIALTPETMAAVGAGGACALVLSLAAALAWRLRPRHLRRRQPLDALRWLARAPHSAR